MASTGSDMAEESIFTWGAPPLKFGPGAVDEIGFEMAPARGAAGPDPHRSQDQRTRHPGAHRRPAG